VPLDRRPHLREIVVAELGERDERIEDGDVERDPPRDGPRVCLPMDRLERRRVNRDDECRL